MDPLYQTPLLELFRRSEIPRDVRLQVARCEIAPRAQEQLGLLVFLANDPDPDVAAAAVEALGGLPRQRVRALLAASDVIDEARKYFAAQGIEAEPARTDPGDEPLTDPVSTDEPPAAPQQPIWLRPVPERIKLALRGTREHRAILIRDPNRLVAVSVLSSPKLTQVEVETFARMGNVADEVLRLIGQNRKWLKSYAVVSGLVRNPRTPPMVSLTLVSRLSDRDLKLLTVDHNVTEVIRAAGRKALVVRRGRRQ